MRATSATAMSWSTTPSRRVDEDERDVGTLRRLERAQLRVVLDPLPLPPLAPQAGGVDQDERARRRARARCRSRRGSCPGPRATISRSCPRSALTRRDLPTFGRPRIATRIASSADLPAAAVPRKPLDAPRRAGRRCRSRAGPRSESGRRARAGAARARAAPGAGSSILFASTSTGLCDSRRIWAISSSPGVIAGLRVDDEQDEIRLRDRRARLLGDRARQRRRVGDVDAAGVDRAGTACRSTRRRSPCGRASRPASRARRPRASR